jgi:hypothetical protein
MGNMREQMERDLGEMLEDYENGFALPVILIAPDGTEQAFSANDPDTPRTIPLTGRVTSAWFDQNPDTGMPMRVDNPIVTLRKSSLDRVPEAGENWAVKIPKEPAVDSEKETFFMEFAPRLGDSFGWIQIPLMKFRQESS